MNQKQSQIPQLLFNVGLAVAVGGIAYNLPAAQTHFAASGDQSVIVAKLLTWLMAVIPGIAAQLWQELKNRGIDVGPVANVNNAILLLIDAVLKKEPVSKVVVTLKNGTERAFTIDEVTPVGSVK